jgi:hypothetical protein
MSKGIFSVLLLVACLARSANAAGAAEITHENFDKLTNGKNAFIKFVSKRIVSIVFVQVDRMVEIGLVVFGFVVAVVTWEILLTQYLSLLYVSDSMRSWLLGTSLFYFFDSKDVHFDLVHEEAHPFKLFLLSVIHRQVRSLQIHETSMGQIGG